MSGGGDLTSRVRTIAVAFSDHLKTEPRDASLAGWGQFLGAPSPIFQIGPYGTAAGIATVHVAFPTQTPDLRVVKRMRTFWNEKPQGKLFPQNVRLAFTVLTLARTADADLRALRDEVAEELEGRQNADGSWNDSPPHSASPAGGQVDATAWAVLALVRCGDRAERAGRGASWLAERAAGPGAPDLLSLIGLAAAIAGHPDLGAAPQLRQRGFEAIAEVRIGREELISFFDYEERTGSRSRLTRDYLCFPAFYPLMVVATALGRGATWPEIVRLDAFIADATERLAEIFEPPGYRPTGARFPSTVDQAMYALAHERIAAYGATPIRNAVAKCYRWSRRSVFVQLFLPVGAMLAVAVAVAYPANVVALAAPLLGRRTAAAVKFATIERANIQVAAGVAATLLFATPTRGRRLLAAKLRRLRNGR